MPTAPSHSLSIQLPLLMEAPALKPIEDDPTDHGEVFTRRWVVDLILDLIGYDEQEDLAAKVAVEPSCGAGAFLTPMIERLVRSAQLYGRSPDELGDAIAAGDLLTANVDASRKAAFKTLIGLGVEEDAAEALREQWVRQRDFLLEPPTPGSADFVIGNPPYIRLEAVPSDRSDAYRRMCATMGGRADVYVGFYEHGLVALRPGGRLGFICADRWMRNAYGSKLRSMISEGWAVRTVISMTGVAAFEEEVDAYPAITILERSEQSDGPLVVEGMPDFGPKDVGALVGLAGDANAPDTDHGAFKSARLHSWFSGPAGWPSGSPDRLSLIADLEARFEPLEAASTGTKVGIGVATGADKVFITDDSSIVETERLLPLAMPRDIASGHLDWSGRYLVNPWTAEGLIELGDWPLTAQYLGQHQDLLSGRHTAKSGKWHKTIDRVIEGLRGRPKLYLPDFKERIFPVLDEGETYPHHNLYWVTSDEWDMRVLGGLLMTDIANLFIEAYSVRMRGGFLRFQAQYLRRIRLPHPEDLSQADKETLSSAFEARDDARATEVAMRLYGVEKLPN